MNLDSYLADIEIKKESVIKLDEKEFYEDKFLDRYKEKGYILKFNQHQDGGNNNQFNNQAYRTQIEEIEKNISHKHKKIFTELTGKFNLKQNIEKYIIRQNKLDDYHIFLLGNEIFIHKLKYDKEPIINQLPKNINKKSGIYIHIAMTLRDIERDIEYILKYFDQIIKNYLLDNGTLIVFFPLIFYNNKFYDYFKKILLLFGSTEIFFPIYFMNHTTNGFLIFKKYKKDNNININQIDNKIVPFYKQINEFLIEEYKIYDKLLTIKYQNLDMFNIIIQKYISYSGLKFIK